RRKYKPYISTVMATRSAASAAGKFMSSPLRSTVVGVVFSHHVLRCSSQMRSHETENERFLIAVGGTSIRSEAVSHAPHRFNAFGTEFTAQVANIDFNHIRAGIEIKTPHLREQLLA